MFCCATQYWNLSFTIPPILPILSIILKQFWISLGELWRSLESLIICIGWELLSSQSLQWTVGKTKISSIFFKTCLKIIFLSRIWGKQIFNKFAKFRESVKQCWKVCPFDKSLRHIFLAFFQFVASFPIHNIFVVSFFVASLLSLPFAIGVQQLVIFW